MSKWDAVCASIAIIAAAAVLVCAMIIGRGCQREMDIEKTKRYEAEIQVFGRELPRRP